MGGMAAAAEPERGDHPSAGPPPDERGLFGPHSVSWRIHRETTVLFGGARALLMHAAHPLVIAGARETGFYERNPWKRLERTLVLMYALTFGTRSEAGRAADHINRVHRFVRGIDEITGRPYDAMDPDLLLWVHACLVDSALLFERLTVGRLKQGERERFHREQMAAAELLGLARERIPPSTASLRAYIREVVEGDTLRVTEASRRVVSLFRAPPREAEWRPVLRAVSWWAFGSLPSRLRSMYGVRWGRARHAAMLASLAALRRARPGIPRRFRWILPAQLAERRAREGSTE